MAYTLPGGELVGTATFLAWEAWQTGVASTTIQHTFTLKATSQDGVYEGGGTVDVENRCGAVVASNGASSTITSAEFPELDDPPNMLVGDYDGNSWDEAYSLTAGTEVDNLDFGDDGSLSLLAIPTDDETAFTDGLTSLSFGKQEWRCDDLAGQGPGCVNPAFVPTITFDAVKNPKVYLVAKHISDAQAHGYPGSQASGVPLHRETDGTIADQHRTEACGSFTAVSAYLSSCDEYPFAHSVEGGTGASIRAVSIQSQNWQGAAITQAIQSQRIIDQDPFWVAVNLPPNDAGSVGGPGTVTQLNDDGTVPPVAGLSGVVQIASAFRATPSPDGYALLADGTVWAWGDNTYGQLGNGTTVDSSTPVQVSGISGAVSISAVGGSAYAILSDGTIWAWGANESGELGDGTVDSSGCKCESEPVSVSGITNPIKVAGGGDHAAAYALLDDGTVDAWGDNQFGGLGNGTTVNSALPVQVDDLTNIVDIAGGQDTGWALDSSGHEWAWGYDYDDQLGAFGYYTAPVYVTDPVAVHISHVAALGNGMNCASAIETDGTAHMWGLCTSALDIGMATPQTLSGPTDVTAIDTRSYYGAECLLAYGGAAWCWDDSAVGSPIGHPVVTQVDGIWGGTQLAYPYVLDASTSPAP